ncbi:MAG: MFS transporter [Candidatus Bathyarchaeia archaeon]
MEKSRQVMLILATLCVSYFVENFLRNSASALSPLLIKEMGISLGEMGLLITAFYLIYGIMQFPSGALTDIIGPRKAILWFTALTCIGSLLFWLSNRYELIFSAQFVMGIGTSVFYINAVTIVSRWFPPERKATAIGILSAASGVGAFTCYMGFPLAETFLGNWRILYLAILLVLFLSWGLNYVYLKDGPPEITLSQKPSLNILETFRETLVDRRFLTIIIVYALLGFNGILGNWINPFLISAKGLTYVEAGVVSSLGTVAGFIGCISVGVISDRLRSRRVPVILFTAANCLLFSLMIFIPSGLNFLVYAGVWGGMCICGSIWVLFFSMGGEVLPAGKTGIGLGLMNGVSIILGSLLAPIYGSLVDVTGSYFTPNIISLGLSFLTVVVIVIFTKETYGRIHGKT